MDEIADTLAGHPVVKRRQESRGGHFRTDFLEPSHRARRLGLRLGEGDVVALSMPTNSAAIAVGV
jgi:hypothetical protein